MPKKAKSRAKGRSKRQKGGSIISDGIAFTKENKLVSKGLKYGAPAAGAYAPYVYAAGQVADWFGFGGQHGGAVAYSS